MICKLKYFPIKQINFKIISAANENMGLKEMSEENLEALHKVNKTKSILIKTTFKNCKFSLSDLLESTEHVSPVVKTT